MPLPMQKMPGTNQIMPRIKNKEESESENRAIDYTQRESMEGAAVKSKIGEAESEDPGEEIGENHGEEKINGGNKILRRRGRCCFAEESLRVNGNVENDAKEYKVQGEGEGREKLKRAGEEKVKSLATNKTAAQIFSLCASSVSTHRTAVLS